MTITPSANSEWTISGSGLVKIIDIVGAKLDTRSVSFSAEIPSSWV
jgi:hypothetical protein